ncbi:MAG: hypothetical protein DMF72_08270 [Acidobacteria bacterium]|nr:MAG: hypothetical protein DMF72_08270 [Acidobacteriota bacterium]
MKTRSYKILIPALVLAATLIALSLVTSSRATAQGDARFKVGDRVEVDTFQHGNYPGAEKNATWRKATIVRLYNPEDRFGGYIVKVNEDGREMRLRFVDTQWIRAPQGADAPAAANNKTEDQTTNTQTTTDPVQAGAVSCPASDDLKGTSQAAIFKRLVDARYEKNGKSRDENNKNVSVSVHFDDFKLGATHPYHHMINNPDGPNGVDGGAVYAVKATYLVCENYPGYAPTGFKGELLKTNYENMTYSCFKDATGDWICNQTGGRQGRPQHLPK